MRFSVTFKYVSGKHQLTADALSRAPTESPREQDEQFVDKLESFAAQTVFTLPALHSACHRYERPKSPMKNAPKSGTTAVQDGQPIRHTSPCYVPTGEKGAISALLMTCFSVTSV